jgi:predicted ABC-type ATPase
MFAGPNGSGKSTVYEKLNKDYSFGNYLNADEIEKSIRNIGFYDLSVWGIQQTEMVGFNEFTQNHSLRRKAIEQGYEIDLTLKNTKIINPNNETNSYEAAVITDFMRHLLIEKGVKLTFETVMAHKSKIETLKKSQELGYRNYLYYVGTIDPQINQSRVIERVSHGGHPVNPEKIESRYFESLSLLIKAIPFTYRTFLFDNSGEDSALILEVFEGREVIFHNDEIPKWVDTYFLDLL